MKKVMESRGILKASKSMNPVIGTKESFFII